MLPPVYFLLRGLRAALTRLVPCLIGAAFFARTFLFAAAFFFGPAFLFFPADFFPADFFACADVFAARLFPGAFFGDAGLLGAGGLEAGGFGAGAFAAACGTPRSCSRMPGFSSVDTSCVISSPRAMDRSRRRMIFPDRVFGRLSAKRMSSGLAMGLSWSATQASSSSTLATPP